MIRAIIFDCFGVLAGDTWNKFVRSLPEDADIEAARVAHAAYDAGRLSKKVAADQIETATGRRFTEVEDIVTDQPAKNIELLDYIRELRAKRYKIGMLSNVASDWVRNTFLTEDEQTLFDDFTLSFEVGLVKPEPAIFELAVKRLGVAPTEAVFVDDKQNYCEAAEQVGLRGVPYENFEQMKADLEKILAETLAK